MGSVEYSILPRHHTAARKVMQAGAIYTIEGQTLYRQQQQRLMAFIAMGVTTRPSDQRLRLARSITQTWIRVDFPPP